MCSVITQSSLKTATHDPYVRAHPYTPATDCTYNHIPASIPQSTYAGRRLNHRHCSITALVRAYVTRYRQICAIGRSRCAAGRPLVGTHSPSTDRVALLAEKLGRRY